MAQQSSKPSRPLLEFGPLGLFFVTNYVAGIFYGTAVLVAATVVALGVSWHLDKRIPLVPALGCVAVVIFGGLTLITEDEFFIKIKPTVISALFAIGLGAGQLLGRNPLKAILGSQMHMQDEGWRKMTYIWMAMFASTAIANEIAWRTLSTDAWVNFKVFGLTGLSLVFAVATVPVLTKYQISQDDSK
ncbi:MAG: septation protein IspZ [Candidatus Puniceispirillaceae bacterium]